jgi:hypothetical protein
MADWVSSVQELVCLYERGSAREGDLGRHRVFHLDDGLVRLGFRAGQGFVFSLVQEETHLLTMMIELKQDLNKARRIINRVRRRSSSRHQQHAGTPPRPPSALAQRGNTDDGSASGAKVKMSFQLVALLVYTVGVKCRGINKQETYAPEHMFSLSEKTANKIIKDSMIDLIKHNRAHLVRIYPKGLRVSSSNYEPHRYWSAGAQLVALNWQTFGAWAFFPPCPVCLCVSDALAQILGT